MFREFYYVLYELLRKVRTNTNPEFNAFIGLSFFQMLNALTIFMIINYFLKVQVSESLATIFSLSLYFIISGIGFFKFYRRRNEIFNEFKQLSKERVIRGRIYFWLYVLITLFVFFYGIYNLVTPQYK